MDTSLTASWPQSYALWEAAFPGGCNASGTNYLFCVMTSAATSNGSNQNMGVLRDQLEPADIVDTDHRERDCERQPVGYDKRKRIGRKPWASWRSRKI